MYDNGNSITVTVGVTFPTKVAASTSISFIFPSSMPLVGATFKAYLAGNLLGNVIPDYYSSNNTVKISPFSTLISKPAIQLTSFSISRPRSAIPLISLKIIS